MRNHAGRGLTLIEVTIASAIFSVLAFTLYLMLKTSSDSYASGNLHATLNGQARNILDRLTRELRDSSVVTFKPSFPNGATSLSFQMNSGFSGGKVTYGPAITYAFAYEPGELDNGKDDNNDGRVDEGRIVRTEGGKSVALTRDAQEGGLTFTQAFGNTVTVKVTLERLDEERRRVTYVRETTLQVRN